MLLVVSQVRQISKNILHDIIYPFRFKFTIEGMIPQIDHGFCVDSIILFKAPMYFGYFLYHIFAIIILFSIVLTFFGSPLSQICDILCTFVNHMHKNYTTPYQIIAD